jgi:CRP-like cAMP-binding protein
MRLPIGKRPGVKLVRKLSPQARLGANANRLSPSRHFQRSAMERLAGFLLAFSRRNTRNGQDPATFELPMTRTNTGDFLGLTIETVSRTFTKLNLMRLIELAHSNHVKLIDIDALAELADGNE